MGMLPLSRKFGLLVVAGDLPSRWTTLSDIVGVSKQELEATEPHNVLGKSGMVMEIVKAADIYEARWKYLKDPEVTDAVVMVNVYSDRAAQMIEHFKADDMRPDIPVIAIAERGKASFASSVFGADKVVQVTDRATYMDDVLRSLAEILEARGVDEGAAQKPKKGKPLSALLVTSFNGWCGCGTLDFEDWEPALYRQITSRANVSEVSGVQLCHRDMTNFEDVVGKKAEKWAGASDVIIAMLEPPKDYNGTENLKALMDKLKRYTPRIPVIAIVEEEKDVPAARELGVHAAFAMGPSTLDQMCGALNGLAEGKKEG
ncbi:Uncharacterised protein [Candidatus Burarchaeum australiense]|nr:Uncharacterised protein [Candidatus Burarchaeum australiense]